MAQEQPCREGAAGPEPIKYGDLFYVSPQVADKPILPEDDAAATTQSAEQMVIGVNPLGSPASLMQSAATFNAQAGLVDPAVLKLTDQIRVTKANVDGTRFVTESVGDQVVGQYVEQKIEGGGAHPPPSATELDGEPVTIGEAPARCARDQPIDMADVATIEAAERH